MCTYSYVHCPPPIPYSPNLLSSKICIFTPCPPDHLSLFFNFIFYKLIFFNFGAGNIFCLFLVYIFYKLFTVYVNGHIIEEEWGWDVDTMSYIDFMNVINSLGYKSFKCLWYRYPRKALGKGLNPLNHDSDILQLAEDVSGFDVVEVCVDEGLFDKSKKS